MVGFLSKIKSSFNLGGAKRAPPRALKTRPILEQLEGFGFDGNPANMMVEVLSDDEVLDYHRYKNPLVPDGEHETEVS